MWLREYLELKEYIRGQAAAGVRPPQTDEEYMAWFYDELLALVDSWSPDFNRPDLIRTIKNLVDAIENVARAGIQKNAGTPMSDNPLGSYTRCAWCGKPFDMEYDLATGYEIALVRFDRDGTVGPGIDALNPGYLCGDCAGVANHGRQLLQVAKHALLDIAYLLSDGYDMALSDAGTAEPDVRDTVEELITLIHELEPDWEAPE